MGEEKMNTKSWRQFIVDEMVEILKKVANGEITPKTIGYTWKEKHAGNVIFLVGDNIIIVFNDCDSWDYIDTWIMSTGCVYDYDWFKESNLPDSLLYKNFGEETWNKMVDKFSNARRIFEVKEEINNRKKNEDNRK